MTRETARHAFELARAQLEAAIEAARADMSDATLARLSTAALEARRAFECVIQAGFDAARERRVAT